MSEVVFRLLWFVVLAAAISYGSYLLAGTAVDAQSSGAYEPVVIRDVLGPGLHNLSGMVMVPTPCDELMVSTQAVSTSSYMLIFKTWREPSVTCASDETPRSFHETLFAPAAGVDFAATLDGAGLPIAVEPVANGH
jgi:hypothetical protein